MYDSLLKYAYIAALLGAVTILRYLLKPAFDPLRTIPGPFVARFTRLWQLRVFHRGDLDRVSIDLHRRYGSIVRMTPNEYSFTDPEVAREIYAISSNYIKSPFYSAFGDPNAQNQNLFANRDPKQHQQDRRQVASMYSLTSLLSYEPYVDTCIELLLAKLHEFADQRQTFNLMDWMQYYAFDVIGEITFGKSFGMMEDGYDATGILGNIHLLATLPAHLGLLSELIAPFYFIAGRLAKRTPDFALYEKVSAAITARKSGEDSANRDDFLAKGLKFLEAGKMEDRHILGTMMGNVIAGSDTTGITLTAILYHLIRNPSAMQKLQKEFDDATAQGSLSTPALFNEAIKLLYFQAVIKEGLRMHPAVGMLLGRVVPEGGRQLGGHFFPAGTVVGVNPWAIHRNTEIFGADADQFRPERWLGPKEKVSVMEQNSFAFGSGVRTCIGRHISFLEINKVIPELLRQFQFSGADDREWTTSNQWFVKPSYECRVTSRQPAAATT